LQCVHLMIREIVTPSWVTPIPANYGEAKAGMMKADQWCILWRLHFPLAFLSLWGIGMPTAAPDTEAMLPVLQNIMWLTALTELVCQHTLTDEVMDEYRLCVCAHIKGLKECFPGFVLPSHHMAFHIYEFMKLFGPIRSWWCIPFEQLIGVLQKIPHNHHAG
ncbi:hypothetical protein L208DRAFT_1147989, partial [Tricholoma matsutake]